MKCPHEPKTCFGLTDRCCIEDTVKQLSTIQPSQLHVDLSILAYKNANLFSLPFASLLTNTYTGTSFQQLDWPAVQSGKTF